MKNILLAVSILFLLNQPIIAATTIKGKVLDKTSNDPLEYATLIIERLPDSSFVVGGITASNGSFEFQVEQGKYVLNVQFMGYKTSNINFSVAADEKVKDLGKVLLSPDFELLDEVEVVAEKSTYEMALDKRVFNVGKDVSSTAGNAIEVLESIPSVAVDVEGNVSLRGDDGVRILIDGKVSGLSGMSTQDALRSVQADMIERIEVVTNPGVRYDAEGTAGIINIILKKDKRKGFNGSVDLRAGYPWQYGVGLNANYRLKRFNFFASYNYNHRENIGGGTALTKYFTDNDPDQVYLITDQTTDRSMFRQGHNVRLGTDYYITDKDILSLGLVYRYSDNNSSPKVTYFDSIPGGASSYDIREEVWKESDPVYEVTLDYDKSFDRKGQSLKANVRYFHNVESSHSDITELVYPSFSAMNSNLYSSSLFQKTLADEAQDNLQATVDYVQPFSKKGSFEAGAKYTYRDISSISSVQEQDSLTHEYFPLADYTYDFAYNEQVAAFYASVGNQWGRWSGLLGVRAEYTNIKTCLYDYEPGFDSINDNGYLDFFPSLHLNYSLSEHDQLQVSYSRRIRRPGYWQLSPFRSYNDNRNIRTGNPALKPVYTDSYELGYLHFLDRASFTFTGYYRHSVNTIRHYTYVVDDISYSMPINFGESDDYGLEAVAQGQMTRWWNLNGNINFFRSITDGEIEGTNYHTDSYMFFGRLVSKFDVKKWFDFQVTGHYMGPRVEPLGKSDAEWWMDAAISKELFQGNGTLTLNVRDVFGTRGRGGESWGDNFWKYSTNTWNKTTVSLNFNYRINQQNAKKNKKNNNNSMEMDSEEEMEM